MLSVQEQRHIIHREACGLNLLDQRFNQLGAEVLHLVGETRVHPFLGLIHIGLLGQLNALRLQPVLDHREAIELVLNLPLRSLGLGFFGEW